MKTSFFEKVAESFFVYYEKMHLFPKNRFIILNGCGDIWCWTLNSSKIGDFRQKKTRRIFSFAYAPLLDLENVIFKKEAYELFCKACQNASCPKKSHFYL